MVSIMLLTLGLFGAAHAKDYAEARELEHFNLLNKLRKEGYTCPGGREYAANDKPLIWDCRLWKAAYLHSLDMGTQNYFSHTSKDGRSPWNRASEQGISANAENIAAGRSSASDVLEQWKNSDGHCRGMMNPSMTMFGVGYAYVDQSYRHYWTQMLKTTAVTADTSCLQGNTIPTNPPVPQPTPAPTSASGGNGNSSGGSGNTGDYDPTQCSLTLEGSQVEKCAKCVTSQQCKDAYGDNDFYCCPYMKTCIKSGMSCPAGNSRTARCSPTCYDQTHPIDCPSCDTAGGNFPNNWIYKCTASDNNQSGPSPTAPPSPTPAPVSQPSGGLWDPKQCSLQRGSDEKCTQCVTSQQCKDAYDSSWYCCPYMKACVNASDMPCPYSRAALCTPRCYDNMDPTTCTCAKDSFPNEWVTGCYKPVNAPTEAPTPAPVPAPTPSPTSFPTPRPTAAPVATSPPVPPPSGACAEIASLDECKAAKACAVKKEKCVDVCPTLKAKKCTKNALCAVVDGKCAAKVDCGVLGTSEKCAEAADQCVWDGACKTKPDACGSLPGLLTKAKGTEAIKINLKNKTVCDCVDACKDKVTDLHSVTYDGKKKCLCFAEAPKMTDGQLDVKRKGNARYVVVN